MDRLPAAAIPRRPRRAPPLLAAAAALGALLVRPLVGELLANTLWITAAATLASALIGTAAAWFIERTRLPGRRAWAVLVAAPLAMPAFVSSYAWVSLSQDLQDFAGALLVVTSGYFPLVYLPVAAALRGLDPALEESARALGCSRWTTFARVILPQLRPALSGGMLLVALGVLSEFGAFQLLRFRTFTTEIYAEYRTSFDGGGVALLAGALIALCLVCLAVGLRLRGSASHARFDRGARRAADRLALGVWTLPVLAGFGLLVGVTLGVPLGMIGYWLTQDAAAAVTPAMASSDRLVEATAASLLFGLVAAAVTTALAVPLALLLVRFPGRLAALLERVVLLAQGVPGLVIALALVTMAVQALMPLYQGLPLLMAGYAILFLPLALVSLRAAFAQLEPRLEDTARALGLGWLRTGLRVMAPLAGPGLGAAAAMVLIAVVTELNVTLLLAPLDTHTLATQVWADTSQLAFAAAAPYAALMTAVSMGASGLLFVLLGRSALLGGAA